jgi:hypothetical protein
MHVVYDMKSGVVAWMCIPLNNCYMYPIVAFKLQKNIAFMSRTYIKRLTTKLLICA